jgi:hypothetical protein
MENNGIRMGYWKCDGYVPKKMLITYNLKEGPS